MWSFDWICNQVESIFWWGNRHVWFACVEKTAFQRSVRLFVMVMSLAVVWLAVDMEWCQLWTSHIKSVALMMIRCEEKTAFQRRVRVEVVVVEVGLAADQLSTYHSAPVALSPSQSAQLPTTEWTTLKPPPQDSSWVSPLLLFLLVAFGGLAGYCGSKQKRLLGGW